MRGRRGTHVVGAIDLGVEVDNGGSAGETAVGAHLGGAHPVVGRTATGSDGVLGCVSWWSGVKDEENSRSRRRTRR